MFTHYIKNKKKPKISYYNHEKIHELNYNSGQKVTISCPEG